MKRLKNMKTVDIVLILFSLALVILLYCYNRIMPGVLAFWQAHAAGGFDSHCLPCVFMAATFEAASLWLIIAKIIAPAMDRKYKKTTKKML